MFEKSNLDIREQALKSGVPLYKIAVALGMAEASFSRKMRVEMPEKEKTIIFKAIDLIEKGENLQIIVDTLRDEKEIQILESQLEKAKEQVKILEKRLKTLKLNQQNIGI